MTLSANIIRNMEIIIYLFATILSVHNLWLLPVMVRLLPLYVIYGLYCYYFRSNNIVRVRVCCFAKNVYDMTWSHFSFGLLFYSSSRSYRRCELRVCASLFPLHFFIWCHLSAAHFASALKLLPKHDRTKRNIESSVAASTEKLLPDNVFGRTAQSLDSMLYILL